MTISVSPFSGPTYHRPSAMKTPGVRGPPTPGSTTHRKTVPGGNSSTYAANKYAAALGLWAGASENKFMISASGASRRKTAVFCPM